MRMASDFEIQKSFSDVGIKKDDIVMIHGDAGVAAQFRGISADRQLEYLIDQIKNYFNPAGTILVPAFSYSSPKNQSFNVKHTPSEVGLFSECFRLGRDVKRSKHPIFSVSCWGKFGGDFLNGTNHDCFGSGTFFEMLLERNVKLVTLGCDLSRVTFVHHIEQMNQVSYRYLKSFSGKIIDTDGEINLTTDYYVRDRTLKTNCNLRRLAIIAEQKKILHIGSAGRFPLSVISSLDFYTVAMKLLAEDEYSLIDEGVTNDEI